MTLTHWVTVAAEDASALGSAVTWGIITLALAALTYTEAALWFVVVFGSVTVVVILIRALVHRERPHKRVGTDVLTRLDARSFPSMHGARVGALFTLVPLLPFPLAVLVACTLIAIAASRLWLRAHDVLDVGAGIALGALIAVGITALLGAPIPLQ